MGYSCIAHNVVEINFQCSQMGISSKINEWLFRDLKWNHGIKKKKKKDIIFKLLIFDLTGALEFRKK